MKRKRENKRHAEGKETHAARVPESFLDRRTLPKLSGSKTLARVICLSKVRAQAWLSAVEREYQCTHCHRQTSVTAGTAMFV